MNRDDVARKMAADFKRFSDDAEAMMELFPELAEIPQKIASDLRRILAEHGYNQEGEPTGNSDEM